MERHLQQNIDALPELLLDDWVHLNTPGHDNHGPAGLGQLMIHHVRYIKHIQCKAVLDHVRWLYTLLSLFDLVQNTSPRSLVGGTLEVQMQLWGWLQQLPLTPIEGDQAMSLDVAVDNTLRWVALGQIFSGICAKNGNGSLIHLVHVLSEQL